MKALKILMTGPGRGKVWLDGEEVADVAAVEFKASAHTVNQVTLTLNVGSVEVDAPVDLMDREEDKC